MLMYEVEDSWRIGYELYYVGEQHLTDGLMGKDYVTMGFMIQKIWDKFSVTDSLQMPESSSNSDICWVLQNSHKNN